jgi:hypothetical protein
MRIALPQITLSSQVKNGSLANLSSEM